MMACWLFCGLSPGAVGDVIGRGDELRLFVLGKSREQDLHVAVAGRRLVVGGQGVIGVERGGEGGGRERASNSRPRQSPPARPGN
jgi:hypothetical protein